MTEQDQKAILSLCMMAAFADGSDEREREQIRRIAEGLGSGAGIDVTGLYQDVLLKRVTLTDAANSLSGTEAKQLAYEMAVCVCDADGMQSADERTFLAGLRAALGLDAAASAAYDSQAEAIAAAAGTTGAAAVVASTSSMSAQEMDKVILNASILNGALELLPESLSTMAIIPLQMRLVYRIGKSHGYELDSGHVKDFLATAGVGLTSQYLEQIGRKLLGGLLGSIGGGLLRGAGRQAVSSGMSFASTYALGHVAQRYYAGGRVLSAQLLRESFQQMLGQAREMHTTYLPQMREQARTLSPARVLEMVRNA